MWYHWLSGDDSDKTYVGIVAQVNYSTFALVGKKLK